MQHALTGQGMAQGLDNPAQTPLGDAAGWLGYEYWFQKEKSRSLFRRATWSKPQNVFGWRNE